MCNVTSSNLNEVHYLEEVGGKISDSITTWIKTKWHLHLQNRRNGDSLSGLLRDKTPCIEETCHSLIRDFFTPQVVETYSPKIVPHHLSLADAKTLEGLIVTEALLLQQSGYLHQRVSGVSVYAPIGSPNEAILDDAYPTFQRHVGEYFTLLSLSTAFDMHDRERRERPRQRACCVCQDDTGDFSAPDGYAYSPSCVKHTMCKGCFMDMIETPGPSQFKCPECKAPIFKVKQAS